MSFSFYLDPPLFAVWKISNSLLFHNFPLLKDFCYRINGMLLHVLQMNTTLSFFHLIRYRKKKLWIILFSNSILILLLYAELTLFVFVVKMNAMWMWCKVQKKLFLICQHNVFCELNIENILLIKQKNSARRHRPHFVWNTAASSTVLIDWLSTDRAAVYNRSSV